jgi:predicted ArsR family transcriptional regulator
MSIQEIDFTKTLNDEQVFETIMGNYSNFSKDWIIHQWNWMNNVYWAFKDHYKYMIIISLVEKTLQFFDQMQIDYSYDEYYSKSYLQIEKFSITELCEKLDLPKETVRRKVLELEKEGVISRDKKKIIIDRKAFEFVKPTNQIKFSAKYIHLVSLALNKEKILSKKIDTKSIENLIKKRFSLCWRWFYRMQIPLIIGYHKFMQDLSTFHIWGTICMNQVLNISKELNPVDKPPLDYFMTNNLLLNNLGSDAGISAMSISDMTQIPRATIIRKCKFLIKNDLIKMNEKKQYVLSTMNFKKILPYQTEAFRYKAKFIRKVLNLLVIS